MGHEYNEMIDILSESINLTESMPMANSSDIIGKFYYIKNYKRECN